MTRVLVYGLAVAGRAVADALVRRDIEVVAADDRLNDEARRFARDLGIEVVEATNKAARFRDLHGLEMELVGDA